MTEEQKPEEPKPEMMHPKCGGCGHNFFQEPQIPVAEALERAKTRRCHYCIEEESGEGMSMED